MIPIITPTYFRYEKYCDLLLEMADALWLSHPPVWFVTDGNGIKYPNTIRVHSDSWVRRLREGLVEINKRYPGLEYTYLVIEDLYPLWPCDQERIAEVQEYVVAHKINCAVFPTYDFSGFDQSVRIGKTQLYKVPESFAFYNQIQPGLWKISHLLDICEYALKSDIHNCWDFELIGTWGHYVSDYHWPSVWNGFLHARLPNQEAIRQMEAPVTVKLKQKLLKEYALLIPYMLVKNFNFHVGSFFEKRLCRQELWTRKRSNKENHVKKT